MVATDELNSQRDGRLTPSTPNATKSLASIKQLLTMGAIWRIWLNKNHSSFQETNILILGALSNQMRQCFQLSVEMRL